jgi:hypothetical protein
MSSALVQKPPSSPEIVRKQPGLEALPYLTNLNKPRQSWATSLSVPVFGSPPLFSCEHLRQRSRTPKLHQPLLVTKIHALVPVAEEANQGRGSHLPPRNQHFVALNTLSTKVLMPLDDA